MSKENRAEIVHKLAAQGMNSSQIARETGFSPGSVYYYMHPEKRRKPEIPLDYKNPDAYTGWNADRKKCKTCKFRPASALKSNGAGCDYCDLVGHSRGCAVEDCDRYEKGNRIERKLVMHDSGYKSKI